MIYVGPTAGEKFYLRTLLMVTKGPKSFDDLKTVDGILCESFHHACLNAEIQTGSHLHHLFATLLLFCAPAEPKKLWLQFQEKICDDLPHKLHELDRTSVTENQDAAEIQMSSQLCHLFATLLLFCAPAEPKKLWLQFQEKICDDLPHKSDTINNHLISQQLNYNHQTESTMAHQFLQSLNNGQRHAFDKIWQSIICKEGKVFFIYGFGGCGKTYLYEALCHALRAEGIIIICVASTGLACLLLPGGQTAHSAFKIPIDTLDFDSICSIPKESLRADLL